MNATTLATVARFSRLAWRASESRIPLAGRFSSLPSVKRFLSDMNRYGYDFRELHPALNGYSVRNDADQVFQFCASIEENEAAS